NPFLYHEFADPVMFHDITSGTNSIHGGTTFSARAGYDLATGMGSIDVGAMATALAAYTGGTPLSHTTKITGAAGRRSITNARGATLSGKLVDTASHKALGGRPVQVEGFVLNTGAYKLFKLHTGPKGGWSIRLTTRQLRSNFLWHAVYAGEQAHRGKSTPFRMLGVAPTLKASSKLPFSGGMYHVAHGKLFTVSGTSNPNMHSAFGAPTEIGFQVRVHGARRVHRRRHLRPALPLPRRGRLRVVVDAVAGHRDQGVLEPTGLRFAGVGSEPHGPDGLELAAATPGHPARRGPDHPDRAARGRDDRALAARRLPAAPRGGRDRRRGRRDRDGGGGRDGARAAAARGDHRRARRRPLRRRARDHVQHRPPAPSGRDRERVRDPARAARRRRPGLGARVPVRGAARHRPCRRLDREHPAAARALRV